MESTDAGYAMVAVAKLVLDGKPITEGVEIPGLGKAAVDVPGKQIKQYVIGAEVVLQQKNATLAEAEMLARAGVKDVFPGVQDRRGNIARVAKFALGFLRCASYPSPLIHPPARSKNLAGLLQLRESRSRCCSTSIAANIGQDSRWEKRLASSTSRLSATPGLIAGGFHLYDGQNHQKSVEERRSRAAMAGYEPAARFRKELLAAGLSVPRIVAGGPADFPIFVQLDDPCLELSPGTIIFHDSGYGETFPDLKFTPAASSSPAASAVRRKTASRSTWATKRSPAIPPPAIGWCFRICPTPRPCCKTKNTWSSKPPRPAASNPATILAFPATSVRLPRSISSRTW